MNTTKSDQLEKLSEDILSIKSVINKNKPLLRQILLPVHFRLVSIILGISIILFAMLYYYFIKNYGGYSLIPRHIKGIIFIAIISDWIFIGVLKQSNWLKSLLKINSKYTLNRALSELFSYRIIHIWLPMVVLIIYLSIYFWMNGLLYYIIPTISIGYGIMMNFIGAITEIRQYLISGYWFLITGIIILVISTIPATIAISLSLGCGMLLFALPMEKD